MFPVDFQRELKSSINPSVIAIKCIIYSRALYLSSRYVFENIEFSKMDKNILLLFVSTIDYKLKMVSFSESTYC